MWILIRYINVDVVYKYETMAFYNATGTVVNCLLLLYSFISRISVTPHRFTILFFIKNPEVDGEENAEGRNWEKCDV